jgi:translocator assembly and maintenance protein 41
VAGRLHKPVQIYKTTQEIEAAQKRNLQAALNTALLLSPEEAPLNDLYHTISSISYLGDIRVQLKAENKNKVQNIVTPNINQFNKLYSPIIEQNPLLLHQSHSNSIKFQHSASNRLQIFNTLPACLTETIMKQSNFTAALRPAFYNQLVEQPIAQQNDLLRKSIAKIVSFSSSRQSIKGIFTAGIRKSLVYGGQKLMKSFRAR